LAASSSEVDGGGQVEDQCVLNWPVATRGWIGANADTVLRMSAATRDASLFANRRPIPAEAASTLSKYTMVPLDVVKGIRLKSEYDVGLEPTHVQPVVDAAAKYSILPCAFRPAEILAVVRAGGF
jgi:hypothetical protein